MDVLLCVCVCARRHAETLATLFESFVVRNDPGAQSSHVTDRTPKACRSKTLICMRGVCARLRVGALASMGVCVRLRTGTCVCKL